MFLWNLLVSGGFVMVPLAICSLAVWAVIFERTWRYKQVSAGLREFHLEATNTLLRGEIEALKTLCQKRHEIPTARAVHAGLERLTSRDQRLRRAWLESMERARVRENQELRSSLWILGTVGSSAPFIGLLGTVVGILKAFQDIAKTGAGGFTVVAAAISESLIATAAGIVVAVVSVMAYNAFQTRWSALTIMLKSDLEELSELMTTSEIAQGAESVIKQ